MLNAILEFLSIAMTNPLAIVFITALVAMALVGFAVYAVIVAVTKCTKKR